ncbi:DUF433 domain-containing protein [Nostoc sp. ChiSLP03a]|uniref:DUF433 domain-containing protein n=1 Tax=Nostoc sp. ChiSLP03a TaxID=3075380 RepID=UPI00391B404A
MHKTSLFWIWGEAIAYGFTIKNRALDFTISSLHLRAIKKILERSFMLGLERITFDPSIMAGQACIRGMRIPVSLVVNLVAYGKSIEEILEEYPDLEAEDIRQSLLYAAWLTQERVYTFKSA